MNDRGRETMAVPLANRLYRRFLNGESAEDISTDLGISAERVQVRLQAAARHLNQQHGNLLALAVNASGA